MGLISTSDCDSSHANLTFNGIVYPRRAFSAPLTSRGAEFSPPTPNEVGSKGRCAYPAHIFYSGERPCGKRRGWLFMYC